MKKLKNLLKNLLLVIFILIGNNVFSQPPAEGANKFVGNITTNWEVRDDFNQYWNQITGENEHKWSSVESTQGQMNWSSGDAIANFARENDIPWRFHTLIWGSQYPSWMDNLSQAEQLNAITNWMDEAAARYPDVQMIDVVNEALPSHAPPNTWKDALGGDGATGWDWIITAFHMARERWPNAILKYNDYNIVEWEYAISGVIDMLNIIIDNGAPIDALGIQSHDVYRLSPQQLQTNIDRLADEVGLPIFVTEYDIPSGDDQEQLDIISSQFPVMWNHPKIVGITFWGYIVGATWVEGTGLKHNNGTHRPALTWLMNYISENPNPPNDYPNLLNLGGGEPPPPPTSGCTGVTTLPNGTYTITARHSNRSLDVYNFSTSDGGNIVQWDGTGAANQQWTVTQSGGRYTLRSVHSDRCLDVAGGSSADGTNIQQWACTGADAQSFCLQDAGNGYYRIINYGSGKAVDIEDISTENGANVHQWASHGGENQQFRFTPVDDGDDPPPSDPPSTGPVSGESYRVTPRHSGKAMDVQWAGTTNGTDVQQWSWLDNDAQKWRFTSVSGGYWRISPLNNTDQALDLYEWSGDDGANICLWQWGNQENQHWELIDRGNGYFSFRNRHSGKCLDVENISTEDGANFQQWSCGTGQNQQFSLAQVSSTDEEYIMAEESQNVLLYPNPVTDGNLYVELNGIKGASVIRILNVSGKLMLEQQTTGSNTVQLDVNGFRNGLYILQVINNDQSIIRKFTL